MFDEMVFDPSLLIHTQTPLGFKKEVRLEQKPALWKHARSLEVGPYEEFMGITKKKTILS